MNMRRSTMQQWAKALFVVCAILLSFMVVAQMIVASVLMLAAGDRINQWLSVPAILLTVTALMYATAIGIIWGGYRLLRVPADFVHDTAVRVKPKKRHIGLVLAAFAGYMVTTVAVGILAQMLFPQLDWNQTQQLGYERTDSLVELIVIGLALVVAAPIMEEIIFRGVMFSGVRRFIGVQASILVTALAFGVAHGQLNVALDTFILGLFLGYLRAETGSVWPAIMLHMLKNLVAFLALFVFWDWISPML